MYGLNERVHCKAYSKKLQFKRLLLYININLFLPQYGYSTGISDHHVCLPSPSSETYRNEIRIFGKHREEIVIEKMWHGLPHQLDLLEKTTLCEKLYKNTLKLLSLKMYISFLAALFVRDNILKIFRAVYIGSLTNFRKQTKSCFLETLFYSVADYYSDH